MTLDSPKNQSHLLRIAPATPHPITLVRNDNFHLNNCRSLKMSSARLLKIHTVRFFLSYKVSTASKHTAPCSRAKSSTPKKQFCSLETVV